MDGISRALKNLSDEASEIDQRAMIPFAEYLDMVATDPYVALRDVFQVFYDMVQAYVGVGHDEYADDPDSINFAHYDCSRLFVEGSDTPFFADRLFANRLMNLVDDLKRGAQQNRIYIFEGPPGSGKSTFLNNLLRKFEEFANTKEGCRYEAVWQLDPGILGGHGLGSEPIEISCPSHDHPVLMIPRELRPQFLDDLFENSEFKWLISYSKEYDWLFRDEPCTICSALYEALLNRLKSPAAVLEMLYARPFRFNRRLGQGVTVFNPGDPPQRRPIHTNPAVQRRLDALLQDSNLVKYLFSRYARTNNGIYALMDLKSHNRERVVELHNIVSEGLHKVEHIEENVNSLFLAVMNPEDEKSVQGFKSFTDRIARVKIGYVLDVNTEIEIYRSIFGHNIVEVFLPRVLNNFARVIISSRLLPESEALLDWIGDADKYDQYCDANLHLLKMSIYTGIIPAWLSEEDRKDFSAARRREIIAESENEGRRGFSGRDAIKIFSELFSTYAKSGKLINMDMLQDFFTQRSELLDKIPDGFLDSLLSWYDYTILQEVKEALYYYNEEQIERDIQNYLFALNFEPGSTETCTWTGDRLEIGEQMLAGIEDRLLGAGAEDEQREKFRVETQREYTSRTLTQEMMVDGRAVTETELFEGLFERFVHNLKDKVLEPFLENENFRRGIKDFATEEFKSYDRRIRDDVTFLITNLCDNFGYTEKGAQEVCVYVIDKGLAEKFD